MHFTKVQIIIKYNKFLWLLNVNVNFVFFVVHAAMCRIVLLLYKQSGNSATFIMLCGNIFAVKLKLRGKSVGVM